MKNDGFRLLDMGKVEARNWAMDTVSRSIREAQIAIYRQDFNLYPAFFWHTQEQVDDVGLREIRYVSGLYDYLDGLAQAFCSGTEMRDGCVLRLRGLEPNTRYQITNWDSDDAPQRSRGSVVMERGVDVRDQGGQGAVVLHYLEIP